MDIFAGLALITLLAVLAVLVGSPRTAQSLDTFAAGFLPYRSAGWPQGVQEEEPVRWSWSTPRGLDTADDGQGIGSDGPEFLEINRSEAPIASGVRRGPTIRAMDQSPSGPTDPPAGRPASRA